MTRDMVQSLGDQSASEILLDLDNESVSDGKVHGVGPFGVFRSSTSHSLDEQPEHNSQRNHEENLNEVNHANESSLDSNLDDSLPFPSSDVLSESLFALQPSYADNAVVGSDTLSSNDWMSTEWNLCQPWEDISNAIAFYQLNTGCHMPDLAFSMDFSPGLGIPEAELTQISDQQIDSDLNSEHSEVIVTGNKDRTQKFPTLGNPSPSNTNFAGNSSVLPPHAADLLGYLKTEVLEKSNSPSSRGMSPWKILLLPCALETVAELSLWNTTSLARRSILSTILAKSAFHLSQSTTQDFSAKQFWLKIGTNHQRDAERQLQLALRSELEGNIKYIEMLMAVLGVGIISVRRNTLLKKVYMERRLI